MLHLLARLRQLLSLSLSLARSHSLSLALAPFFASSLSQARFKAVDSDFRTIIADIARDDRVVMLANRSGLVTQLDQIQDQVEWGWA